MSQPVHDSLYTMPDRPGRYSGSVDQDYGQPQNPRGIKLGAGTCASSIFGDDMRDGVRAQQGEVFGLSKRPACNYGLSSWQRQGRVGGINQPQQIEMLAFMAERAECLFADSQKHAGRAVWQSLHRRFGIGHGQPCIVRPCPPCRTFQRAQRHIGHAAGSNGIGAHLRGKGMGRVDNMGNVFGPQIGGQSCHAAKTANPRWQGLAYGRSRASGIGKNGISSAISQNACHLRGFTCATQQKDTWHV